MEREETTEKAKRSAAGDGVHFALGGPVYFTDYISQITNPSSFQIAVVQEIQGLMSELSTTAVFDDQLSVDELRVFTEEELVEKALEALKESEDGLLSRRIQVENNVEMETACSTSMSVSLEGSNVVPMPRGETPAEEKALRIFTRKKRGKLFDRDTRARELENANFKSVEQFARIKQIQDADKAAARLHSFRGTSIPASRSETSKADSLWRLHTLRSTKSFPKVRSSNKDQHDPVAQPEVLLCVEVYDSRFSMQKTQELFVLGSQKLTALRDNIYCSTDRLMQKSGQSDPSGYFLIEGLFLNDLRDPHAVDYSKPILEWLVNSRNEAKEKWEFIVASEVKRRKKLLEDLTISEVPSFSAMDMDKIYFRDLHFRLGSGYLYCHQACYCDQGYAASSS
ncbi:snRNA activating complex family protein isoform X2 [Wolffia australiana]